MNPDYIEVIIPTRDKVNPLVLKAIPKDIKVHIAKDTEFIKGQTKLRHHYAKIIKSRYILLLDDDIVMKDNAFNKLYEAIHGYNISAVCGDKKAIAYNNFSKGVIKFKEYPTFIKTGFTLWVRGHFLAVMNEVPAECPANVGDLVIGDILNEFGYNYIKLNNIVAEHYVKVSRKGFFDYRYKAGKAMAWYYLKWKKKGYLKMLLKMFFGIPLSRNQGVLIYRIASTLGLLRGFFK